MLVKAFFTRKDQPGLAVPCLFNPNALEVVKSNKYAGVEIPGLGAPVYQFECGQARSLTMDLMFDTYEEKIDVRLFTDRITGWDAEFIAGKAARGLMDIDPGLHAPPVCLFVWGTYLFQCIIERVTKKFTMFLPQGIPVRATLNVTLKEYTEIPVQVKQLALQSADITKTWVVRQGDSLWSIAADRYGDPRDWRLIADANGILNPRLINPGQELEIPVKDETAGT